MNTKHWRGAVAGVVLGMILVVENGKDSVEMPEEFRTRLTDKVKAGLYGDAHKPPPSRTKPA